MARYDYRCTACDSVFEVEHGMRERPQITCPSCGAPCTRVLNASGIVLKGSGFYNTDMRGKTGGTEGTGTAKKTSSDPKPAAEKAGESAAAASSGSGSGDSGSSSAPAASSAE